MKQHSAPHRRAIAVLLAAVALPSAPVFAQDIRPLPVPAQTQPPAAPTVAPTPRVAPPPVVSVAPDSARMAPAEAAPVAQAERPAPAPQRRAAERPAERAGDSLRARRAEALPAATVAAPAAAVPALTPLPEVAAPIAQPAPSPVGPAAEPAALEPSAAEPTGPAADLPVTPVAADAGRAAWFWLVLGLALIGVVAGLLAWRRRRPAAHGGVEGYYEVEQEPAVPIFEPVPDAMAATAQIVPAAAVHGPADAAAGQATDPIGEIGKLSVGEADGADIDAMAAASEAPAGRPWLELMMRPMRAGTNRDDAIVEFELTVSNAGDRPARDVRISTWMFAAGSDQESEMERLLIDPPADAKLSEVTLAPGDGTRIEAAIALPTARGEGSVLPVLVADARYKLPGGGEGRTSASFEIGLARGDEIEGFSTERPTGMHEDIDARLHAEPQHA